MNNQRENQQKYHDLRLQVQVMEAELGLTDAPPQMVTYLAEQIAQKRSEMAQIESAFPSGLVPNISFPA